MDQSLRGSLDTHKICDWIWTQPWTIAVRFRRAQKKPTSFTITFWYFIHLEAGRGAKHAVPTHHKYVLMVVQQPTTESITPGLQQYTV